MKNKRESKDYVVYFHVNKKTKGVFYVGIGTEKRAFTLYGNCRSKYWNNYINKYGGPAVQIKHDNLTAEEASNLETKYILHYGRRGIDKTGILVNRSIGGELTALGYKHSLEARRKISEAGRHRVFTDKMREALVSRKGVFKHTEASKFQISISKRGKKINKIVSEEEKAKIIERNRLMVGEKNARSKKVINIKTKEIFPCASEVDKMFFGGKKSLLSRLNGRRTNKTNFQYLDDFNAGNPQYVNPNISNQPIRIIHVDSGNIYHSIAEAARKNNMTDGAVHFHLKGRLKKSSSKFLYA